MDLNYQEEIERFSRKESKYTWDELEEMLSEAFDEEELTSEEYDTLMRKLMDLDCE